MTLLAVPPTDVAVGADELLSPSIPTRQRALAVLDGALVGHAWVDDPVTPTALLVIEDADGTVYAGGSVTRSAMQEALAGFATASGDLIFGFAGPHDPVRDLVPAEPYWRGEAIDFTDRRPPDGEPELVRRPPGLGARLVRLDRATLPLTAWYEDTVTAFGSIERWEQNGIGYAVMIGDAVVAESVAGPRCRGLLEMGVTTREDHRRRGYGTLVSRAVARECEARGDRVWWNANAGNLPSLAIARRIGFSSERRYDLVACHAPLA